MNTDYKDFPTTYTVQGSNYEDCKDKLQKRYGDDFFILGKRLIPKGGFLGFFQKEDMEVTYAVRPREMQRKRPVNTVNMG